MRNTLTIRPGDTISAETIDAMGVDQKKERLAAISK